MICPQCRALSPEGSNYCFNCGARLASRPTAPAEEFAFEVEPGLGARAASALADVPEMHWFLVLVYGIITLGIYGPVWFLRRLEALNRLRGERKLNPGLLVASLMCILASLAITLVLLLSSDGGALDASLGGVRLRGLLDHLSSFLDILAVLLLIHQSLTLRRMLKDHRAADGGRVTITALWTVLFQEIHLQHVINGMKDCERS